jgi:hypothetical protein
MNIEKKLILCSILAIAIGIATIIPLEYLMAGEATANAQIITPYYDVTIPYVYVNLNQAGGNNTATWDAATIQGVANFTLTPDALSLRNAEAQAEFYRFRVYSDKGDIVNLTYSMAVSIEQLNVTGIPGGCYTAITGSGPGNRFSFADGTTYNGDSVIGDNLCSGGTVRYIIPGEAPDVNYTTTVLSSTIADYNGKSTSEALTALRSAQKLYIDISRICIVAYNGAATETTATTTTMTDSHVLQHIELTRVDSGFVYGTYKEGTVPFPMQTP